jgi:segregation and condensation protein B
MDHDLRMIEAILFASSDPVPLSALAERLPEDCDVSALLAQIEAHYRDRGICLTQVAGGWTFRTAEDLASHLRLEKQVMRRPSRAAVETLAVIAYHQPATRSEVEEIRGVAASRGTFDVLLEAGWIRPVGRRNSPGRPVTWGTTPGFLEHFGLASLADLPGVDELKAAGLIDTRAASVIVGIGQPDANPSETGAEAPGDEPDEQFALSIDAGEPESDAIDTSIGPPTVIDTDAGISHHP